jgi:hypothetical protein
MAVVRGTGARSRLLARMAAAIAGCVLLALGAAYYLTYEPAPRIAILWRQGIEPERRAELERRFLLVNRAPERERFEYDLLDTSRGNIEALVREPDAADTDRVDRQTFVVPFDVPYGASWMWVAHRLPVLRTRGVVPGIVLTCVAVLIAGGVAEMRRFRRAARRSGHAADRLRPGLM